MEYWLWERLGRGLQGGASVEELAPRLELTGDANTGIGRTRREVCERGLSAEALAPPLELTREAKGRAIQMVWSTDCERL